MVEKKNCWGYELLVDCGAADKLAITSEQNISNFSKELVDKIEMVAYGDPWIKYFATHDPAKGGFTLFQAIETSAIVAHFVSNDGSMFLDVHSCKWFNTDTVLEVIQKYFKPERINHRFVYREVPQP